MNGETRHHHVEKYHLLQPVLQRRLARIQACIDFTLRSLHLLEQ